MAWLLIASAFFLGFFLFILVCYFIKFHFSFNYEMPKTWEAAIQIAFFNFKHEWNFSSISSFVHLPSPRPIQSSSPDFPEKPSQAGFIRFPSTLKISVFTKIRQAFSTRWPTRWSTQWKNLKKHFRRSALRFLFDLPVWGILLQFLIKSGLRTLKFLSPKLEKLHIGLQDPGSLGTFAAIWSPLAALIPWLNGDVYYHFNPSSAALKIKAGIRFSVLGFIAFLVAIFFSFPWIELIRRFLFCWRNPGLNWWQRRLLLF